MSTPAGVRLDMAVYGPIAEGDLFVLAGIGLVPSDSAGIFPTNPYVESSAWSIWTLGYSVTSVQLDYTGCGKSYYSRPQLVFSSALTGLIVEGRATFSHGATKLIYCRYRNYQVLGQEGDYIKAQVILEAVDIDTLRSLGYISVDFVRVEPSPYFHTIRLPNINPTNQLYAGVPFLPSANGLSWGFCGSDHQTPYVGYCPNTDVHDGYATSKYCTTTGQEATLYVTAIPLTYYQANRCLDALSTPTGRAPLGVSLQQCLMAKAAPFDTIYGASPTCQNLVYSYTDTATCQRHSPYIPVTSSPATGNALCGSAGIFLPFRGGLDERVDDYQSVTTTFGPCASPAEICVATNTSPNTCQGFDEGDGGGGDGGGGDGGGGDGGGGAEPPPSPPPEDEGVSLWLVLIVVALVFVVVIVIIFLLASHKKPAPAKALPKS